MQSKIEVECVIGAVSFIHILAGRMVLSGSLQHWQIQRPIMAFQKPTTIQGKVSANNTNSVMSSATGVLLARV
jgi:hypothetical protein